MRKIKLTLQCRVPSWNFCNYDGATADMRYSKDVCRFCVSSKGQHRCLLYDTPLRSDEHFIYKPNDCIRATAGFAVTVDEPQQVQVDPKLIIRETLKAYNKTLNDLLKQGYPRELAQTIATQYLTGDN